MNTQRAARAYREFMEACGLDTTTPHAKGTPERVARMFVELTEGLREPPFKFTAFPRDPEHTYDQLVTVLNIPFMSLCAHHHVPYVGKAHVGYLPLKTIIGLSKIVRAVQWVSRKPSIQEDITEEVALLLERTLKPRAVLVMIEAEHFCVSFRGVQKPGSKTVTHCIRGHRGYALKDEFLQLVRTHHE